jgi:very-short-patch-repair endonuclease
VTLQLLEILGLYRPLGYHHKRFDNLAPKCNRIEAIFWSAAYFELSKLGEFTPQYEVDRYRLDFALVGNGFKIAIEIDGHDSHKSKLQRMSDYQRERRLKKLGWRFIRFTGSDIYRYVQECVADVSIIARGMKSDI